LEFLGGQIGNESLSISGMPTFKVGDDDYLFVEPNRGVICPLIAAGHGRYPVRTDEVTGESIVYRENGRPLSEMTEIATPLDNDEPVSQAGTGLTPTAFEREILSTLNRLQGQNSDR
jgi:hypothetical protein